MHSHLWTVWEVTKKDIRSPGDMSLRTIKDPPAKIVPRTMPVEEEKYLPDLVHEVTAGESVKMHQYSQFRTTLDMPWNTAIPVPSVSFIAADFCTSAAYILWKTGNITTAGIMNNRELWLCMSWFVLFFRKYQIWCIHVKNKTKTCKFYSKNCKWFTFTLYVLLL